MSPFHRIPVAWCMLTHRKGRFALSMLGIAFSVVIMFMEIGFFNGINDSQARFATLLDADLVLMHKGRYSLLESDRLNRIRMQQALAVEGVASATALYEGEQLFINPETGMAQAINVVAFPAETVPLKLPGLARYSGELRLKGNILFDRKSRRLYGDIRPGTAVTLGGAPATVVGLVDMGPTIRADGTVLMGEQTWTETKAGADLLTMALLKLKPGAGLEAVRAAIRARLTDEVLVMTPDEIREREVNFTARATPAGGVFAIGLTVGFIIGLIICYQILFNEISDNMPQYATVKAVGFSKSYLVSLVMQQALLLAVFGYLPGLLGGLVLYHFIESSTSILMFITVPRGVLIFVLTVVMCAVSGLLAVRKVLRADPAEVF